MQTVTKTASAPLPKTSPEGTRIHRSEEAVYQVVTVGAILLVLGSLWIF